MRYSYFTNLASVTRLFFCVRVCVWGFRKHGAPFTLSFSKSKATKGEKKIKPCSNVGLETIREKREKR